jgi:Zn-dependent protease
MYFPKATLEMGKPGKFSRTEVIHILISMIVLTIAFAFPLSQSRLLFGSIDGAEYVRSLPIACLALVTAFIVHELAHKFMAQKYGLWSEFRMFPVGLLLSVLLAVFTGVVFAAPGAVMFRGDTRPFEMGKIAVAGSFVNIVVALITYILYSTVFLATGYLGKMVGFVCAVNALLATFNLLPFASLDGKKVIKWNGIIWAILFIIAIVLTIAILPRLPYFLFH